MKKPPSHSISTLKFRRVKCVVLMGILLLTSSNFANEVRSTKGIVSSRSEFASNAGVQALAAGGNAIDASVAAAFTLAVTYPAAGNLGGGGFMVIRLSDGSVFALDHREMAPSKSHRDMFLDDEGEYDPDKSLRSRMASGVPGSVAGLLSAHARFGKLKREQVLAEAIRLAENGFTLPTDIARQLSGRKEQWLRSEGSADVFLQPDGSTYEAGETFVQKDLATTLRRIAQHGAKGFYEGETADLIVAEMQRGIGLITHEDLKNYAAKWRVPVKGSYRSYEIYSMPPPSSGGVLLVQMLNMLETYDVRKLGFAQTETMHLMSEVERRAYADRAIHLGDSDFYPVPIEQLIDKEYATQRLKDFSPKQATQSKIVVAGELAEENPETTHLSVIDGEGNAVALTTTLNSGYGSGYVVQGAGFLLNNEMDDFSAKPGVANQFGLVGAEANAIEPRKRMLSSMTPTIVVGKDESMILATGTPGGSTIITTVLQVIVNVIDHEMTLIDAVASPRFHHQWLPDRITLEAEDFSEQVKDKLKNLGHKLVNRCQIGDVNAVLLRNGKLVGVSDPRHAGKAVGLNEQKK